MVKERDPGMSEFRVPVESNPFSSAKEFWNPGRKSSRELEDLGFLSRFQQSISGSMERSSRGTEHKE